MSLKTSFILRFIPLFSLFSKFLKLILSLSLLSFFALKASGVTYCLQNNPTYLNAQIGSAVSNSYISEQIHQTLVRENQHSKIIPYLATSFFVSHQGLVYTFNLPRNIGFQKVPRFHPTRLLNAEDVLFSFERMMNPKHPYYQISGGHYTFFKSTGLQALIQSISAPNSHQIVFVLRHKSSLFLKLLSLPSFPILSKEYAKWLLKKGTPEQLDQMPIGTGPFMLTKRRNGRFLLQSNPGFSGGAPKIKKILIVIIKEKSTLLQRLHSSWCTVIPFSGKENFKNKSYQAIQGKPKFLSYLAINTKRIKQPKVRRAIAEAINKEDILRVLYSKDAQVANSPTPPSVLPSQSNRVSFEPKKAQKILSKAFSNQKPVEILVPTIARAYSPNPVALATMIQQDLKEAGMKIKITPLSWASFLSRLRKKDYTLAIHGWAPSTLSSAYSIDFLGCQHYFNLTNFCSKKMDALLQKGLKKRGALQKQTFLLAMNLWNQKMPLVPLVFSPPIFLAQKNLKELSLGAVGVDFSKAHY